MMMSTTTASKKSSDATMMCCASCGIAAVDEIKLKDCNGGCDLVKYCNNDCQDNHREQHEEECKKRVDEMRDDIQRRAAELRQTFLRVELRDNQLFTQPDGTHLGECPICCLPLSIDVGNVFTSCCSKWICKGCDHANKKREIEAGLQQRCAFCREPPPKSDEEAVKNCMKRVKKNDPAAMRRMGKIRRDEGDYQTALEYLTKAAELGDAEAHYVLSCLYAQGQGVEKDLEKEMYHSEEAAIGGHHKARYDLGIVEWNNGRFERARKHFIIAANLGYNDSLQELRELYAEGHASKEDYASALRAYQAAVEETKSAERDKAEEAIKSGR
jgi:tetratricopeptide (TPR) repeat protein